MKLTPEKIADLRVKHLEMVEAVISRIAAQGGCYGRHPLRAEAWATEAAVARAIDGAPTHKGAAVALANKMARMAWAIMVHGDSYKKLLLVA